MDTYTNNYDATWRQTDLWIVALLIVLVIIGIVGLVVGSPGPGTPASDYHRHASQETLNQGERYEARLFARNPHLEPSFC